MGDDKKWTDNSWEYKKWTKSKWSTSEEWNNKASQEKKWTKTKNIKEQLKVDDDDGDGVDDHDDDGDDVATPVQVSEGSEIEGDMDDALLRAMREQEEIAGLVAGTPLSPSALDDTCNQEAGIGVEDCPNWFQSVEDDDESMQNFEAAAEQYGEGSDADEDAVVVWDD